MNNTCANCGGVIRQQGLAYWDVLLSCGCTSPKVGSITTATITNGTAFMQICTCGQKCPIYNPPMSTQPKWRNEFIEEFASTMQKFLEIAEGKRDMKYWNDDMMAALHEMGTFVSKVEHQTILRCVEEISKISTQDPEDADYWKGFRDGLDASSMKLQDLTK